jgi:hypothetical protein
MILIIDDTFEERKNDYPVGYFKENMYSEKISIIKSIRNVDLIELYNKFDNFECIAIHSSFKVNDPKGNLLAEQTAYFDKISNKITEKNKYKILFSGGESRFEIGEKSMRLNKSQFYFNLKEFLDYYIEKNQVKLEALQLGRSWIGQELSFIYSNIQNSFLKNGSETNESFLNNQELMRFISISNAFDDETQFGLYVKANKLSSSDVLTLLKKITKSYFNYGKCIYNFRQ